MGPQNTKLYRSRDNRKIAGVCGGLGKHLNIDPRLLRWEEMPCCFPAAPRSDVRPPQAASWFYLQTGWNWTTTLFCTMTPFCSQETCTWNPRPWLRVMCS